MATYDFTNLSDNEFELIVRDLLSASLAMPFEVFMPGRDRGIDLRCISEPQHQFIVQVKHYAATGWSKLYSHLRRDELPKVKALSPSGYGLATSVPLTPDRKQKIVDLFSPFIDSSRHVWGQDDLNAMLRQHPDVERAHFKLWLTSTEVLTAVLHARVSARGRLLADEITERARLFVENSRLPHAVEILKNNRILVVSGTPGIGKTTLAEMLLAMLLADGYELHVVSADIDEAMDVYRAGVKQVFFYDDFLGMTTAAEVFGKNEDARLATVIRRIRGAPDKYFIMTTREYLLREARERYARLHELDAALMTCVLSLADYSKTQRAQILYNHLYFSDLSTEALRSVVANQLYFTIIDSPNYTPRLIQQVVELAKSRGADNETFGHFALDLLGEPDQIWGYVYRSQLTPVGRSLLLNLACFPRTASLSDFLAALNYAAIPADSVELNRVLKSLEGTLLNTFRVGKETFITIRDPSVRDFLVNCLGRDPNEISQLSGTASTFEQSEFLLGLCTGHHSSSHPRPQSAMSAEYPRAVQLCALAGARRTFYTKGIARSDPRPPHNYPLYYSTGYEARLLNLLRTGKSLHAEETEWELQACEFLKERWTKGDGHKSDAVKLWSSRSQWSHEIRECLEDAEPTLDDWLLSDPDDAWDFIHALEYAQTSGADSQYILEQFKDFVEAELDTLATRAIDADLAEEYDTLRYACEQFGLDLDNDDRSRLVRGMLSVVDRDEEDDESFRQVTGSRYRAPASHIRSEEADIRAMFDGLVSPAE